MYLISTKYVFSHRGKNTYNITQQLILNSIKQWLRLGHIVSFMSNWKIKNSKIVYFIHCYFSQVIYGVPICFVFLSRDTCVVLDPESTVAILLKVIYR